MSIQFQGQVRMSKYFPLLSNSYDRHINISFLLCKITSIIIIGLYSDRQHEKKSMCERENEALYVEGKSLAVQAEAEWTCGQWPVGRSDKQHIHEQWTNMIGGRCPTRF